MAFIKWHASFWVLRMAITSETPLTHDAWLWELAQEPSGFFEEFLPLSTRCTYLALHWYSSKFLSPHSKVLTSKINRIPLGTIGPYNHFECQETRLIDDLERSTLTTPVHYRKLHPSARHFLDFSRPGSDRRTIMTNYIFTWYRTSLICSGKTALWSSFNSHCYLAYSPWATSSSYQ